VSREVKPPHAGPGWSELATLDGYAAVLDPADRKGVKNRFIDRVHKHALTRALSPIHGQRVLDFGCGTGRLSEWLVKQGATVDGVDATPEMVRRAREAVPVATFHEIDGFALPFADDSHDAVVSVYVLQYYVADPDAMGALLAEFARVLRPGSRVVAIEQVTDSDIGRGGTSAAYCERLAAAGYGNVAARPIRLGQSRVMYAIERRPWLASLPFTPRLVTREAQRTLESTLVGGRYADTLLVGTAP
jgi:SAM-dependent methyltransferase